MTMCKAFFYRKVESYVKENSFIQNVSDKTHATSMSMKALSEETWLGKEKFSNAIDGGTGFNSCNKTHLGVSCTCIIF